MKSKAATAVVEGVPLVGHQKLFDYSKLDQDTQITIQLRTSEIKSLAKRVASDIVEIGEKLAEVKDRLGGNGRFVEWLEAEMGWSERTAYNFIAVYSKFGKSDFEIENIATSALYLLAAPSTPAEAVATAKQIANQGGKVTHTVAKELKRQADAKKPKQTELIQESDAASTASPAETSRRPMEELVATVKRFSGRILTSTLVNNAFTPVQITQALNRKLIEKRDGGFLWYVEPEANLPAGWVFDDSLEGSVRAIHSDRDLKTPLCTSKRDAILAAHEIETAGGIPKMEEAEDIAICLCGCRADQHEPSGECTNCICEMYEEASPAEQAKAKAVDSVLLVPPAPPLPPPVVTPVEIPPARSVAWLKERIEIAITLMPTDGAEWHRKVLYSVRAGDDMPFVAMSAGEGDLSTLPPKIQDLLVKLSKHVEEKASKPSPPTKPASTAKKTAQSKTKAAKPAKSKAKGAKK